eukprot:JP435694.1.p1 GENE.JP435694.1~~JP435694.1.p1  ORF type:complete len:634 (-),score=149.18 JP435694.1:71-1906(-)
MGRSENTPAAAPPPVAPAAQAAHSAPPSLQRKSKKWTRSQANTNVMSVRFEVLAGDVDIATGDPVFCSNCRALFSKLSTLNGDEWTCEFCSTANKVYIEPEEMPQSQTVDYILESALGAATENSTGNVIFCLDTSGSMCVTSEVKGDLRLRGQEQRMADLQKLNTERENQYLPGQARNVTYVSRLQCTQAAVKDRLDEMTQQSPNQNTGLVLFGNDVTIVGDAVAAVATPVLTGDKLSSWDACVEAGKATNLEHGVKHCNQALTDKIFSVDEMGATALGPALVTSIAMASRQAGSKVVICTDGLANIGMGSLENLNTDEDHQAVQDWYTRVGEFAADQGVTVSIVSIKGTDCNMEYLGSVATATGGTVNIVDPLRLTKEFSSMLADEVIATNVTATLKLHSGMFFKNEDSETSEVSRDMGNVTKFSEITFEYGVRSTAKAMFGGLRDLPFQLQIRYKKMNGMKCIRVVTQSQPITSARDVAEEDMDVNVLGANVAQQSAQLAMDGNYGWARANLASNMRLMSRASPAQSTSLGQWCKKIAKMDSELNTVQRTEVAEGRNLSDCEDEVVTHTRCRTKLQKRKQHRGDSTANVLYRMKGVSASTVTRDASDSE